MSTIFQTTDLVQRAISQRRNVSAFENCWTAFQEWRKWERLRRDLCSLSDRELMDIGITLRGLEPKHRPARHKIGRMISIPGNDYTRLAIVSFRT